MGEFLDSAGLALSLHSPFFFRQVVRPELYRRHGPDSEDVHAAAIEMANRYAAVLAAHQECFDFPELTVDIKGIRMQPFGTAAGMDKNGDALVPFSYVFGFQTIGTVPVDQRIGNDRPRVAVDSSAEDAYNAQGFPSMGKDYVLRNLKEYRTVVPHKPVIANICGLPHIIREDGSASFQPNRNRVVVERTPHTVRYKEFSDIGDDPERAVENAYADTKILLDELEPYVEGFEWNIFSPNTATLPLLRKPDIFHTFATLVSRTGKLSLAKMGPYDGTGKDDWLALVDGWLNGGGDGITAVNTYPTPRKQLPVKNWGYPSAGRSGRFLKPYRMRAISDTREAFPNAIIFATGGISDGDDAYETFTCSADAVEGYTPFTFHGLGLNRVLMKGVSRRLQQDGYRTLEALRQDVRTGFYDMTI